MGGSCVDGYELCSAVAFRGRPLALTAPADGQCYVWSVALQRYVLANPLGSAAAELLIGSNFSTVSVLGPDRVGGHPFDPARHVVAGMTTELTLEAQGFISSAAGMIGVLNLYDHTGVLVAMLSWVAGDTSLKVGSVALAAVPAALEAFYAEAIVVGGDGISDTFHLDSVALVVSHS